MGFLFNKVGDEPIKGFLLATYVPKDIFTDSNDYHDYEKSGENLENKISKNFIRQIPHKYRFGLTKSKQEETKGISFVLTNLNGETRSNNFSLTGKLSDEQLILEPGKQKIFLPTLDLGLTYSCIQQVKRILDVLEKYFIFLAKKQTVEPDVKMTNLDFSFNEDGNKVLSYLYPSTREFIIAVKDGKSLRKQNYVISSQ